MPSSDGADLYRRPREQVILASAGRIRSRGTGPGGARVVTKRRERSATNARAGAPSNIRVKRLYSEKERGEMDESTSAVRLPGAKAARQFGHVCGFFLPATRRRLSRAPFPWRRRASSGAKRSSKSSIPSIALSGCARLEEVGISPAAVRRPGQVEIRAWEDAHLRGGRFDQEAMMALLEETLRDAWQGRRLPGADSTVG